MNILGLNAFHGDSSACVVVNGQLIAAAEEERFRRIKHWAGFPSEAIRWCLAEAGISLSDLEHVAINQNSRAHAFRKISYLLSSRPQFDLIASRFKAKSKRADIGTAIAERVGPGFRGNVHFIEHHLAHLSSAYLVSPFDDAVAVSVDGFGDFASAAWGVGTGGRIRLDEEVYFPHSLGIFYQAMTQFLGFPHYGDEYKVMGLAPYGKPEYLCQMRQIVKLKSDGSFRLDLKYFRHARERIPYEWDNGDPTVGKLFSTELIELLGPARSKDEPLEQRHRDLARSIQAMYEEAFFHLLNALHSRYRLADLALAGGCAMNSVANGKVYQNTPFRRLYIQSAAGDAGGAIGAAFIASSRLGASSEAFTMDHAYWGPQFSDAQIEHLLTSKTADLDRSACTATRESSDERLFMETAQAVSQGAVVGWFQGRMEWGPRALGNRSIIGDPRRADMKDILNRKIKRRESFRPFAPSILREATPDWFETDDDVPFMMQVYQVREERRREVPAVTHVDGSGRLQTVTRGTNPRYYALIDAFRAITGVPMVLNTSFNENEPVVCTPAEALDCFLRTNMDLLVMGNWMVRRREVMQRSS